MKESRDFQPNDLVSSWVPEELNKHIFDHTLRAALTNWLIACLEAIKDSLQCEGHTFRGNVILCRYLIHSLLHMRTDTWWERLQTYLAEIPSAVKRLE
jgi:hypothetical protein